MWFIGTNEYSYNIQKQHNNELINFLKRAAITIFLYSLFSYSFTQSAYAQQPPNGSSCPIPSQPSDVDPDTLIYSEIKQGSNSDANRLALIKTVLGTENVVQVSCQFSSNNNGKSGTWTSSDTVTHILVKASTVRQIYEINSPGTSGNWTTQCHVNPGGNQPGVSGVFCYRATDVPNTGTIKIKKKAIFAGTKGDVTFEYNSSNDNDLDDLSLTVSDTNPMAMSQIFTREPGTFNVTEVVPDGWQLTNVSCTGDVDGGTTNIDNGVNIDLDAGENIVCEFTNVEKSDDQGTIKIIKKTIGDVGTFEFDSNADPTLDALSLTTTTANNNMAMSEVLVRSPGKFDITERVPGGWKLTSVQCVSSGAGANDNNNNISNGVEIVLDANENVVCTFTNKRKRRRQSRIIIRKVTVNGVGTFEYQTQGSGLQDFSLTTDAVNSPEQRTFDNLNANNSPFTITEVAQEGWTLAGISCDAPGGQSSFNINNASVQITLAPDEAVICTYTNSKDGDDKMDDVVKKFIKRRLDNLLTHGPDRSRILRRLDQQRQRSLKDTQPMKLSGNLSNDSTDLRFSTSLSQIRAAALAKDAEKINEAKKASGALGFSTDSRYNGLFLTPQRIDIWAEGHLSKYEDGDGGFNSEGDFKILYFGVDYAVSPMILIGALVQLDWTSENIKGQDFTGEVEGHGWMAGPYVGLKLKDWLFFDARAAWGQSDNDIILTDGIVGTRTGKFDTDRWLATAQLTGLWNYHGFRISPSVQLSYGNENQDAFKNSLGQNIGPNDISLGRLTFGPEIGYQHKLSDGTVVEPHVSIQGIWNFDSEDITLSNGLKLDDSDLRGRVEGGVIIRMPSGFAMRFAADYDGIGDEDFEAYGGQVWINVPLN